MAFESPPAMSSQRPYLLRAIYEWIADNGMTPHLLVNARTQGVRVPPSAVKDGQVVLNVAERATGNLRMDNDQIQFNARFGGVSQSVRIPMEAVLAIYARENGMGLAMPADAVDVSSVPDGEPDAGGPPQRASRPVLQPVPDAADGQTPSPGDEEPPPSASPPSGKRPGLRVVK